MPQEIEIKLRVDDFDDLRRSLRRAGAEYHCTLLQTDRYLDTPDKTLMRRGGAMRLRVAKYLHYKAGPRDPRPQLTLKGKLAGGKLTKQRMEIQTHVDDQEAILEILASLGFAPHLTVQKRRIVYKLGRCSVEMDELPLIGRFVEIEGPSEPQVLAAAKRLGLTGESILTSYVHLLLHHCRQAGQDKNEFVFEDEQ
ncbi:MAG: CYTH domain protein [Planctomycetes bacterium ADurb.Bin126]|nr:MAG: CYTH domain protein [Planctomycetes bacterium ADurb.Bin126]HOD84492.1 class IV adenylate cyclase [Phycisphaerae bacterium]HQL74203.1 class IV adenylate cyclase [Phycisphaerae bacterium]